MLRPPPLAPGLPFVGNGLDFLRDAQVAFVSGYQALGPIFRIRWPGRRYTVLAGPRANAFLLRGGERHLDSAHVYRRLAGQLRTNNYPLATTGDRHRHLRRTLGPAFSREAISRYVPRMAEVSAAIVAEWQPGARVRVPEAMRRILADQLGLALLNRPLGDRLPDALGFARTSVGAGLGAYPEIALLSPLYRRARRRMFAFLREIIAEHRAEPPGRSRDPDFVDLLSASTDVTGAPLGEQDIVANAQMAYSNTLLYAAPAAAFLVYGLLKHPDALEQVTAEVDEVLGDDPLTMATLRRLPLLEAATKESMRLYPIALSTPRIVAEPFEFEGHRVEAGEMILIATTVCHFLPELFPEPYRFDLGRYGEPRNEHRQPGAFVPFGLGPRPCPATGLVETVAMVTVATLLRAVRVALDPPGYVVRRVVKPFPEPEDRFTIRVLERRRRTGAAARQPREDPLQAALPALGRETLARLGARVPTLAYGPGEVIIRQGDPADRFYVVAAGEVEVLHESPDRPARIMARLGPDRFFGEIGLLQNVPRTATVRAVGAVSVLALDRETFTEVVAESDLTSAEIGELVRRRIASTRLAAALPSLSPEAIGRVSPRFETLRYPPGASIVRQGDPADRFYIIAKGEVEVVNHHPSGHDIVVGWLGAGDYFGEIGLLHDRPRTATVRATTEVEVMALDRDAFRSLMDASTATSQEMARRTAERLIGLAQATAR